MARLEISFPLGLEGTEGLPQSRRILKNCFNAGGPIIQRPGITSLNTTGGVARGGFEWNGSLYGVISQGLRKFDVSDGSSTLVGTIAGTNPIVSAIGFNDAVIVVKGGNGYTLDKSDVLTQITDPDYVASDYVTHMNGRFIYIPTDGSPAFFSDVGAGGTIQALSFFDAEELPDANKACINFRNVLYIFGSDSIELFRDFGEGTVPYRRLNARIDNGYIGGLLEYNNTFLFVGREKGQDVGIYSIGQGIAPKISNEYIDTILATYTETELSGAISGRIKWHGFDIATFTLQRHSFGFLGGNWFELDVLIDGVNEPWRAGYIIRHNLKYYTLYSNQIGYFDAVNKDYGESIERVINVVFEGDGLFSAQSLEYRLSQGYNAGDGSVALQVSEDNVLFTQPFHRNTGAIGEYSDRIDWNYPGGLGSYDSLMAVKISTAEDIDFSASKIFIEMR